MVTKNELIELIKDSDLNIQIDNKNNKIKSCYYTYVSENPNKCLKTRISDHLTYLRTWVAHINPEEQDIHLDKSTNICIVFAHDVDDATKVTKEHKRFIKSKYLDRLSNGFDNPEFPKFVVKCFVYNCNVLSENDIEAILNRMKEMLDKGQPYTDDFAADSKRRAVQFTICSIMSENKEFKSSLKEEIIMNVLDMIYEDFENDIPDIIDTDLIDAQESNRRLHRQLINNSLYGSFGQTLK